MSSDNDWSSLDVASLKLGPCENEGRLDSWAYEMGVVGVWSTVNIYIYNWLGVRVIGNGKSIK